MTLPQSKIFSDVFSAFYTTLNSHVTDPLARNSQWIFSCVDEQTECLTAKGWKTVHQLEKSDKIYTWEGRFEPVLQINKYPVANIELIKAETRDISMRLTSEHRVFGWSRSSTSRIYPKIVLAKELKDNFCIPQLKECITEPKYPIYSDEFVQLLGWIITEGFIHKTDIQRGICIYQSQSANPDYVNLIREILKSNNIEFTEKIRKRNTIFLKNSIEVEFYLKNRFCKIIRQVIPNKKLTPHLILSLTKSQRRLLLETMIMGDGGKKGNNYNFTQKDKENIDLFAMLAILAGYRACISKYKWQELYVCHISSKSYTCVRKHNGSSFEKERYSGLVWCPSVKSGIFLARRNGRTFFTGNSFPEEDLIDKKVKYPVIIIEPAKMTWETFTQTKNWNMIEISISAYSLQMIQADSLLNQINDAINSYRNDLKNTYNLSFIKLTGTDTDFTLRGAARAHIRSVTYTMQRAFTTGLAKGNSDKTLNSNARIA